MGMEGRAVVWVMSEWTNWDAVLSHIGNGYMGGKGKGAELWSDDKTLAVPTLPC